MSLLTVLIVAICISVPINIFLVWYSLKMIRELVELSTVEDMFVDIDAFSRHLKGVYELETFYGDETLQNLLSHSTVLKKEIEKYKTFFSLIEATEDDKDERFEAAPQA